MANAKAAKPEAVAEDGAETPKGGGKMKLVVLAAVGLLVLGGGGGAAAYFMGLFGSKDAAAVPAPAGDAAHADGHADGQAAAKADEHKKEAAAPAATDAHGAPGKPGPSIAFVELPDILVNLRSSSKRMRFLKLKVALEVKDEAMAEKVKLFTPRILDGFQIYLRALEVEEIEGSRGMQALKEELMARINHAVTPSRIADVLFKEILVQ